MRKQLASRFGFEELHSQERGVALILTLAIIALVTLLLIAFVTSMRVESAASKNFNDLIKARELAQGAVDQAVATIRQATAQRSNDGAGNFSTYVTFPGVIWTNHNGSTGFTYLFSNPSATDTTNLNSGYWITGNNNEFSVDADSQINVGWQYVTEDGTVGTPPFTGHGAIVGRFAYWVDDEAAKINLNTAGVPTPPDTYGTSTSNDVDLSTLQAGLNASAAISAIQSRQLTPGFTTIEEVKLADTSAGVDGDFNTNHFYLTTYSNDANYPSYADDLDAFDRQRLVLSTLSIRDVLGSGGGGSNNAFAWLKDPTLGNMYSLSGSAANFRLKYPSVGGVDGLQQIVANIISYQSTTATPLDGLGTPPAVLGLAKTPYINEIQVKYTFAGTPPAVTVTRSVQVELIYLYDTSYTSAGETITISGLPTGPGFLAAPVTIPVSGTFGGVTPPAASYLTFTEAAETPVTLSMLATLPATPITITYGRGSSRLDFSGLTLQTLPLDPTAPGTPTVWHGAQAADPCVNDTDTQPNRWEGYTTSFAGTLGNRNVWQHSNPFTGGGGPAAYPFGADMTKAVIRGAPMKSIGELGYIHGPAPFQHLSMSTNTVGQIPDWAMMDLFTIATPSTAGRININGAISAGTPSTPALNARRLVPLNALLNSAVSPLGTLPQAVYDDIRTVGADRYGLHNGRDGIFDSIGEICDVAGVADNAGVSEAAREATIRRIANLITVRSNTFTIWVLAQSIKQPNVASRAQPLGTIDPNLDFPPTGEVKAQAVVERYENPPGSKPEFRTRYFRYLFN